ncbi:hypothetical protein [Actinoallomurus rhizosphaericola]|uniref:hypothetical protein n=1 Tax=Actinoallomurus rhizosphaericola TaxID=2952536 RepID=UPI00209333AC|nr:hypothetical protein [Actinoallomurus rhizosphaericola]MCO5996300.1 hypothetical protein [Actinoallomurus rhizosphaericola]
MADDDARPQTSTQPGEGTEGADTAVRRARSRTGIALTLMAVVLVSAVAASIWCFGAGGTGSKPRPSPHAVARGRLPPDEAVVDRDGVIRELPYVCGAFRAGLPSLARSMKLLYSYGEYSAAELPGTRGGIYQTCGGDPPLDQAYDRHLDANATRFATVAEAKEIFERRLTSDVHGGKAIVNPGVAGAPEKVSDLGDQAYAMRLRSDGVQMDLRIGNVVIWLDWAGSDGPAAVSPPPAQKGLSYGQARQEALHLARALLERFPRR